MTAGNYEEFHEKLEREQPWTRKEIKRIPKYEREFIRDIQISKKIDKKKALNWYVNEYVVKSKKQRRQLRKVIIDDVESTYPKHKKVGTKLRGEHKLPTGEPIKRREFSPKFDSFEDWNQNQIINNKNKGRYYERIVTAHKKQPTKSLKELRGHSGRGKD